MNFKKTILTLASVAIASFSFAQSAGDFVIGGDISFVSTSSSTTYLNSGTSTTADTGKTSYFMFTPNVNYFIVDNFSLGLGAGFLTSKEATSFTAGSNSDMTLYDKINGFNIALSGRYYVQIAKKLYYTPAISFGVTTYNTDSESVGINDAVNVTTNKTSQTALDLDIISFEYKPSDSIGLGLSYGGTDFNAFTNDITVGIKWYL